MCTKAAHVYSPTFIFDSFFVPKVLLTLLHVILTLLSTFYSYYTVIYVHYSD